MKRGRFVAERSAGWDELDALLERARGRAERLGPDGVLRLGALYRAAAADLGLARRELPGDPVTARLHGLVVRGRQAVYAHEPRRQSVAEFFATGYWRRVRERPGLLATALVLLLVPAVLAWIWGLHDPGAAVGVVPGEFRHRGAQPLAGRLTTTDEAGFAGEIFTNNIRVTFAAVALGITLGLGSAALAIYNGVTLGALGGIAQHDGDGTRFVSLVTAHGVLELSCIAVAVMAGLRIGWALVDPRRRSRGDALRAEARPALELVLGTMPWLVVAGLVEGFFTGSSPHAVPAVLVGAGLGTVYWTLVVVRGARAPSP
jgi:uncharacterized membrane protein SpoIIM required for sporulation